MRGKLIVIEGIDSSGKDTQSDLFIHHIREQGIQIEKFRFPNYDSPTGKIIGGPYLGKEEISSCWFPEGTVQVDPKIAALYYAADRKYNIHKITWLLDHGIHVILDRYVYSNMAHQGCKLENKEERKKLYQWLDTLEFNLLELPRPDIAIFLHMPVSSAQILMQNRISVDTHEKDDKYLKQAEASYLELAELYNFHTIECTNKGILRPPEDIQSELLEIVLPELQK